MAVLAHHTAGLAHLQAAIGEGDPARHWVGLEGRRIDLLCPVRLGQLEPLRVLAVLPRWIEWHRLVHGGIEGLDGGTQPGLVLDAVEFVDQAIERVGFDEMRIVELVLAVEEVIDLGVEICHARWFGCSSTDRPNWA